MGRTRIVAEAIFKAIKSINKKYKKKYLKGRTIPGINSEISWHYRAYNLRIAVNHANPADLGSTDKKTLDMIRMLGFLNLKLIGVMRNYDHEIS